MSQKQAISQTPIDLKPEDEARTKAKSGAASSASPEANPTTPPSGEVAQNRDQPPRPSRPQAPRRIPEGGGGDNTVQIASSTQPGRPAPQKRPPAPTRSHVPANDDMPSIGGLIYAMQQRPSRSPFLIALIASAIWFALGLLVSWAVFQKAFDASGSTADLLSNPAIAAVVATVVIPIALFWFLAILVWRAQELRLMSSAMTEVAVRLAEPDRMAEQSVASLGQTVRRQVAAMNDAISRALGRAGELEALVHNEVAALDRSYTENENRIRNLINELASEREALANNSERVSEALRGIGSQVTREITAASEKASQSLSHASFDDDGVVRQPWPEDHGRRHRRRHGHRREARGARSAHYGATRAPRRAGGRIVAPFEPRSHPCDPGDVGPDRGRDFREGQQLGHIRDRHERARGAGDPRAAREARHGANPALARSSTARPATCRLWRPPSRRRRSLSGPRSPNAPPSCRRS